MLRALLATYEGGRGGCRRLANIMAYIFAGAHSSRRFTHHEEMRCLALRFDKSEVLVGTGQVRLFTSSLSPNVLLQYRPWLSNAYISNAGHGYLAGKHPAVPHG